MEFSYRLTGTGWSEARIADAEGSAVLSASYLSDALGNLLEALGLLLEGAEEASCSWDEEPGEYRWLFLRNGEEVSLRILVFDDQFPPQPEERGRVVFETRQPLSTLASTVADAAASVLAEHGEDGYKEKWVDDPFPTGHLSMIRERLAAR